MVREVYFSEKIIPNLNHTQITLVPKVKSPEQMSDFCPISCGNFLYKVISKTIASRLRRFIAKLVSPFQTAFIPHRSIQENIIITHEALHSLKSSKAVRKCSMAIKLDMKKVYE